MEDKKSKKKLILSGIFFVLIVGLTFRVLFSGDTFAKLMEIIPKVDKRFLFIGALSMSLFVICEGLNIRRLLKLLKCKCGFWKGIKYSSIGFFFSSITPSASGGQPMQLYFMSKDNVNVSVGTLALIVELASYQVVTLTMAIIGFIYQYKFIESISVNLKLLLGLGVFLNFMVFVAIMIAMFSKSFAGKAVDFILNLLGKFNIKKIHKWKESAHEQIKMYHGGVTIIKNNPKTVIMTILTTLVGITGLHSVTYFVYRSFGLSQYGFFTVLALQAVLYIAVSAIPLPGAVGVSEGGFMMLFKTLFTTGIISSAVLLSRGLSFYLYVIITGLFILIYQGIMKAKEGKKHEPCNTSR
ncbi:MAG: lysylphosphatidylglycerol synthase transmembrane domain-containing protein [Anaerovoracaceae bacterium]